MGLSMRGPGLLGECIKKWNTEQKRKKEKERVGETHGHGQQHCGDCRGIGGGWKWKRI